MATPEDLNRAKSIRRKFGVVIRCDKTLTEDQYVACMDALAKKVRE